MTTQTTLTFEMEELSTNNKPKPQPEPPLSQELTESYTNMIKKMVVNKFSLWNVDTHKKTVNEWGYGIPDWIKLSYDDLAKMHNYNIHRWGLKMGKHENNRKILCL